ncbi:hypothetical protein ABL78_7241 [Leptomonas seymouri]|uniref:Uncharacterized protein n=1 Tax=Leptomonas seymouri TaxID=5684 RepID=A0A0N1HZU7_LEPSE|nr:hypothetical protein ABL78_7241 [Leptomonas seymouri]|eukprot:KPI83721.1 hypothetical protein ABL78_7241 [Leptomonas seymouri]
MTAQGSAAAAAAAAKVARLVSPRLRVVQRDYLTRRGGRTHHLRSAVSVDYTPAYFAAYRADPNLCPRLIDAEAIHGDEQAFWSSRRDFYRSGASRSYYPTWDRQAQALVMLTRQVARVPQEAAFRLFTLGLKMMLLPRLVTNAELMLPSWALMNAEGLLGEALEGNKESKSAEAGAAPEKVKSEEGTGATPADGAAE